LPETGHDNFCDMPYLMPRELSISKMCGKIDEISLNKNLIFKIIEIFILEIVTLKKNKNVLF
jgi:hypothetical protein